MTEIKIGETWVRMLQRLAVAVPLWVLARFEKRSEGKGLVVKAIPFVIMLLSLASITNLAGRAYVHHGDYSAYATGAGIAVLVPVAVIAAMLIEGVWAYIFWGMAFVFAAVSGTIQYNIYLMPGAGAMGIAEAIAFGYGVPVSEVMLAIMETRLVLQYDKRKKAEKAEIDRKAEADRLRQQAEQQAAEERQRRAQIAAEDREFERQRKAAELEAYKAKLQQATEIEREKALAALRIKEKKAVAMQQSTSGVAPATQQTATELQQLSAQERRQKLYELLQDGDKGQTFYAGLFGVNRSTVSRDYAELVKANKIYKNGDETFHIAGAK